MWPCKIPTTNKLCNWEKNPNKKQHSWGNRYIVYDNLHDQMCGGNCRKRECRHGTALILQPGAGSSKDPASSCGTSFQDSLLHHSHVSSHQGWRIWDEKTPEWSPVQNILHVEIILAEKAEINPEMFRKTERLTIIFWYFGHGWTFIQLYVSARNSVSLFVWASHPFIETGHQKSGTLLTKRDTN